MMQVSYGGVLKSGYPRIIHLHGIFHYKPSILGVRPCIKTSIYEIDYNRTIYYHNRWFSYVFIAIPGNGGTPFKCFSRGSLSRHRVEPPRGAAAGGCRAGRVGRGAWGSHHVNYMDIVSLSIYIYMYTSYNAFIYIIYVSSYTQRDIYVCMHMRVCVCLCV